MSIWSHHVYLMQVVTLARLVPSNSTTSSPVTASASVNIDLTGCPSYAAAPGTATITKLNTYKSRIIKWSVQKTATPAIAGDTLTYSSSGANTVAVSVVYSRQFEGGLTLSVNGVVDVPVDGAPPLVTDNKVSGSRTHRVADQTCFDAMFCMSSAGTCRACLGMLKQQLTQWPYTGSCIAQPLNHLPCQNRP